MNVPPSPRPQGAQQSRGDQERDRRLTGASAFAGAIAAAAIAVLGLLLAAYLGLLVRVFESIA